MCCIKFIHRLCFTITIMGYILFNACHSYASSGSDEFIIEESDNDFYHIHYVLDRLKEQKGKSIDFRLEISTDENLDHYRQTLTNFYEGSFNEREDIDLFIFLAFDICSLKKEHPLFETLRERAQIRGCAANASATAYYNLGLMYLRGYLDPLEGDQPNYKKAKKYLTKAERRQHVEATYKLGLMYLKGDIKSRQNEESLDIALEQFQVASTLGHTDSHLELCRIYQSLKISNLFKGAQEAYIDKNHIRTLFASEDIYTTQGKYRSAVNHFKILKNQGDIKAGYNLARLYALDKNKAERAFPLFWSAARSGIICDQLKKYIRKNTIQALQQEEQIFELHEEEEIFGDIISNFFFTLQYHNECSQNKKKHRPILKSLIPLYTLSHEYLIDFSKCKHVLDEYIDDSGFMVTCISLKSHSEKEWRHNFIKNITINKTLYTCIGKKNIDFIDSIMKVIEERGKCVRSLNSITVGLNVALDILTHKKERQSIENELQLIEETRDFVTQHIKRYFISLLEATLEERNDRFAEEYQSILTQL